MILSSTRLRSPSPLSTKRNTLFNFVGCLVYQGGQWAITVLVVHLSGYFASGQLAYAMAIGNVFLPIATFNIRTYQISDVTNRFSSGAYIAFRFLTIGLALILIVPYTFLSTDVASSLVPVLVFLLFKIDEAVCDVLSGIHQRGERMDYIGISQFLRGIVLVLAFSVSLMLSQDLTIAIFSMFLSCFGMTALFDLPHARRFGQIDISITLADIKKLLVTCFPLVVAVTLLNAIMSIARQTYSNEFSVTALGLYAAVSTPAVLVQAAARYLYSPALVPLSFSWNKKEKKIFLMQLKRIILVMVIGSFVGALLLSLSGPVFLTLLYGSQAATRANIFTGMLIITAVNALVSFMIDVLIICRDIKGILFASILSFLCSAGLSSVFEKVFGMQGINIAILVPLLLALIITSVRLLLLMKRRN